MASVLVHRAGNGLAGRVRRIPVGRGVFRNSQKRQGTLGRTGGIPAEQKTAEAEKGTPADQRARINCRIDQLSYVAISLEVIRKDERSGLDVIA